MNIKDEIILSYIVFAVTITMLVTRSAIDGMILLTILASIVLISKEAMNGVLWSQYYECGGKGRVKQ